MQVRIVPPCSLGTVPSADAVTGREGEGSAGSPPEIPGASLLVHARLWIDWQIEAWDVRRQGRLHFVRDLSLQDESWRRVELARHPLRVWPRGARLDDALEARLGSALDRAKADLESWLASWRLVVLRAPQVGLVSEIGETRDQLRARLLAALRPELQRRLAIRDEDPPSSGGGSWLPWRWPRKRRESAETSARQDGARRLRSELGRGIAGLADSIEELDHASPREAVRQLELGVLVVGPDVELASR
jgi:hypothetical protein